MEQEIEQLRSLVEDLFMKVESLEERVSELEEGAKPAGPEPLLTCVQCLADYKESENADGHCKYHSGTLNYGNWKATFTCCNASAGDREKAKSIPGCTKGRHHSKHHCQYMYANYFFHMQDLSNKAKELWLEMDVKDLVTDCCEWGEVGLSADGKVFVLVGSNRIQPVAYAEFTMKELKQSKKSVMELFKKTDPVGWNMKAELHAKNNVANAIVVSIKSASSKVSLVKKLNLVCENDSFKPGAVETESDPSPHSNETGEVSPLNEEREGPQLEPGPDYSQDRKTDYPTETNDDMFALELEQDGKISVNSTYKLRSGKWNNLFTAKVRLSNGVPGSVSITNVYGEYMNKDGEWVKCDSIWIRPSEAEKFLETLDFTVDGTAPLVMVFQLAIGIDAPEPGCQDERQRAHFSLPQPLHLRLTCVDTEARTASLRMEQGNPPMNLACYETRQKSWAKSKPLLFYLFADDVDARKRSDVAIYYDDNGMVLFRPAPNDVGSTSMFLKKDILDKASFQAKGSDSEVELPSLCKENKGSSVKAYAIVKGVLSSVIKVVIKTPTSSASGMFSLPRDDFSSAALSISSQPVIVNSNFTVNWNVGRVSKNDKIALFSKYGSSSVARGYNKKAELQGECQIKAPTTPGEYEVRYYPSWLTGSYTGRRHDTCVASTTVNIVTA